MARRRKAVWADSTAACSCSCRASVASAFPLSTRFIDDSARLAASRCSTSRSTGTEPSPSSWSELGREADREDEGDVAIP